MSGLCGWIGHGAAEQDLIDRMAAPLARFDGAAVEAVNGTRAAVAVAAGESARHLYVADGLLVALWGNPVAR